MELPAGFVLDTPAPPMPPKGKTLAQALMGDDRNAGIARTAFDQAGQGLTFNLMDEGQDVLGSGIAYAAGKAQDLFRPEGQKLDESYGEIYDAARADTQKRLARELEQRMGLSIASNVAGGLLTGGAGASTKTGTALANSLRTGGLVERAGKAALLGAASGGLSGAGAGSGAENRLESSGYGALAGGITGGAIPVVGAVAGKVAGGVKNEISSLMPKTAQSMADLRAAAKPLYEKFTQSGGVYSDKLTNEIADLADAAKMKGIGGQLKPEDEQLNSMLDYYSRLRGAKLSPAQLQELDQSFADDIARMNAKGEYNFGRILNNLKYEMRDRAFDPTKATGYIESGSAGAVEALKEANRLYAQSYKAADVEKILAKAKGTENPQTSIRTNLKNLLANDKKMKNYTADEKAVLEDALKRGYTGGLVKLLGGRLVDSVAGGVAGLAAGGPMGAIGGAVAGKAVGGVMADAAGGIQANRLRGALQNIQGGATTEKGGLPAIIGSKSAGQFAAPAGQLSGTLNTAPQPTRIEVNPGGVNPYQPLPDVNLPEGFMIDGADSQTVMQPMSQNLTIPQGYSKIISNDPNVTPEQEFARNQNPNDLMSKIKGAESAGNPNAQNPNSSASGLYQFTDSTWKSAVDKWGRRAGIKYSDKANPQAQEAMMSALTQDNSRILQNKGIQPTDQNVYFAHFMGAPAASKAISMLGKNVVAARSFPDAAKANPEVFFDGKRPRTIDEVYELITSKVG